MKSIVIRLNPIY